MKRRVIKKPIGKRMAVPSRKQLSNPFSTGSGGTHFEENVQASFLVLMLSGGNISCAPGKIIKIKLQGRVDDYDTDDLIVFVESLDGGGTCRILAQIKHVVDITKSDEVFGDVINSAWRDFNNPAAFTKGKDVIALISELSSASLDVRRILDIARSSENAKDFLNKTEKTKFFGAKKQKRLDAFRSQLKKANGNVEISDAELFEFLRHFHLFGYDLDSPSSINFSLLLSHIGQISQENTHNLWSRLVGEISNTNQNSGVITFSNLSSDLKSMFQKKPIETAPSELAQSPLLPTNPNWNTDPNAQALAIANLVGSWNENSAADKAAIGLLWKAGYDDWIAKLREILQKPGSPLSIKNGVWSVADRQSLWVLLGSWIFDEHLDGFIKASITVLSERDPQFDLPPEERYAASMHKKVLNHSRNIRNGFAEGLALLGGKPESLNRCTRDKPKTTAWKAVHEVLGAADWRQWGSLNDLIPLLAEASPDEFLNTLEKALGKSPCPFDELYLQERGGFGGRNYITGLLWGLEALAWDERYLVQSSIILGGLASRDPGGNWGNRPSNSLTAIFLPWLPQTTASIKKRKVALQTLRKETPEIAWKLLLTLLPNQTTASSGSYKPIWKKVMTDDKPANVSNVDYWELTSFCINATVEMSKNDAAKLSELIPNLDNLSKPAFEEVLNHLKSEKIRAKTEDEKSKLWTQLVEFSAKHKNFPDAKWALGPELISMVEDAASALEPMDLLIRNQRLFSSKNYYLRDGKKDWQEQERDLAIRRQQIVKDIWDQGKIGSINRFIDIVDSPYIVGFSLGCIGDVQTDSTIIPKCFGDENKNTMQFTEGYVKGKHWKEGWSWVDRIVEEGWTNLQILQFLIYLPFTPETWKRARKLLRQREDDYWKKVFVNPYQASGDLYIAADKLCEIERPLAAIECIWKSMHDGLPLDKSLTVKALLAGISTKEPVGPMTSHNIEEVIKALQDDSTTDPNDLFKVEWAYLQMLERSGSAVSPKTVERHLVDDPTFFCELIRLMYRSKNEPKVKKELSKSEQAIAANAYRLLDEWHVIPGTNPDGTFSPHVFKSWLKTVIESCTNSGHLEVALIKIGHVLVHSFPDPDGLWMHHEIASVLNDEAFGEMRGGYRIALFNSRGVHMVDPTGKPELEIAKRYRKQAEDVENAGYQRLAATLKNLADEYDFEAKRIVDEHTSGG